MTVIFDLKEIVESMNPLHPTICRLRLINSRVILCTSRESLNPGKSHIFPKLFAMARTKKEAYRRHKEKQRASTNRSTAVTKPVKALATKSAREGRKPVPPGTNHACFTHMRSF
jgi:hypothetical protein